MDASFTDLQPPIERSEEMLSPEVETPDLLVGAGKPSPDLLSSFWAQRRFLWRLTSRTLVITTIVVFLLPKTWKSTARLMPPDQNSGGLSVMAAMAAKMPESLAGVGGVGDLFGMKTSGALFVGILRSRTVQDRLIDKFDLRRVYREKTYVDARKVLEERTEIAEDRKNGIITVTVSDRDPTRARNICAGYIAELDRLVAQLSTSSARRERAFLEERLKAVKTDLDQAQKQLSEFSSKHATIDISVQGKAMVEAAALLQGQLIAAESEQRGLQTIYTANNFRVRAAEARVAELRRQLDKLAGQAPSSSAPAGAQQQDLSNYPSIRQLPILGITYVDLYRNTKMQETVYETLTRQYELAKVEEAKEIPTVRVLDVPAVPEKKASPKRLQLMFLGTALAFILGLGWIRAKTIWERTHPSHPRKLFAQEVYGTIRGHLRRAAVRGALAWPGQGFSRLTGSARKRSKHGDDLP